MVLESEPSLDGLVAHLARAWPGRATELRPGMPEAREALGALDVARFAPGRPGEPWVYATVGAWQATRELSLGLEFFLLSPREDERHVETLSSVAYFHSFYGLDEGSVLRVARGWFFDSACDRFLVVAPGPGLGELEWVDFGGRRVRTLRLLPVTQDEDEFQKKNGRAALDARFAASRVDFLDPKRASVV
jgi:hypothetical protein